VVCALAMFSQHIAQSSCYHKYIGNVAKPQLIKNSKNTIIGFRNLLGKQCVLYFLPYLTLTHHHRLRFNEVSIESDGKSAAIVDLDGEIGYHVQILIPPPKPVVKNSTSARSTPAPTRAPSPPPPVEATKTVTVSEITTMFLRTLKASAEGFLGRTISGAVISVSDAWDATQRAALTKAAGDAGIHVLQFAPEEALALIGAHDSSAGKTLLGLESTTSHNASDASAAHAKIAEASSDRISLVLDLGSSSLTISLLSIKESTLIHSLLPNGARHVSDVGGDAIDSLLIGHFLTEFMKKTKIPVAFPSSLPEDRRAEAKLRLAMDDTKKSLQASIGAAACSVESLKDGVDFSGTINRLRFDVLLAPIYATVIKEIAIALECAGVAKEQVDEVLLVGGSSGLSGLSDQLETYFGERSNVAIRSDLDGSQLIAKGAALQAKLVAALSTTDSSAFAGEATDVASVSVTSKPIGLVFPGPPSEDKTIPIVLIAAETPLPARRTVRLPISSSTKSVAFEVWEGGVALRDLPKEPKPKYSDVEGNDDEVEDAEEEPEKEAVIYKETLLGGLSVEVTPIERKGSFVKLEIQTDLGLDSSVTVMARSVNDSDLGAWVSFSTSTKN
jgi:heat shock protein 1/8